MCSAQVWVCEYADALPVGIRGNSFGMSVRSMVLSEAESLIELTVVWVGQLISDQCIQKDKTKLLECFQGKPFYIGYSVIMLNNFCRRK